VAYEQPGYKFTLLAAADLRTHQFKFVDVDATGRAALGANGGRVIGVNQGKPNTGEAVEITHSGISKVYAGAAVAAGDEIMSDATGRAITATSTNQRIGVALQAAAAANVLIAVLLRTRGAA
jgi:predicted RecA/RadA family phage recombinase